MPVEAIKLEVPEYDETMTLERFKIQVQEYSQMIDDIRQKQREIQSKLPVIYQKLDRKRSRLSADYDMGDGRDGRKAVRPSYLEIRELEKDLETLINNENRVLGVLNQYRYGSYQYLNHLMQQGK